MDIRRFGPGHRRPEGPPGTRGLTGQVIWSDRRAAVSELAFAPQAVIVPHSAPDTTLMIVVSGGGWVQVGDERTRIRHGEAVVLPPGVPHGAWTDGTEMRVILVELPDHPETVLEATATHLLSTTGTDSEADPAADAPALPRPAATPGTGSLAERMPDGSERDESEGEPW